MPGRKYDSRDGALPFQSDLTVHENTPDNADECGITVTSNHSNLCDQDRDDSNAMKWQNYSWDFSAGKSSLLHGGEEWNTAVAALSWTASITPAPDRDQPEWWPCTYSSGKSCNERRIRKSTGGLHRFCKFHAERAKVHQRRSVNIRRSRSGNAQNCSVERDHDQVRASASITHQVLQCVSSMPPHAQRALLDAHGFRSLAAGRAPNASVDGSSSSRVLVQSPEGLDELKAATPLVVLVDNLKGEEVQMLRPYIPSWFWEFVDVAHASLDQQLQ
jgi:hypothetical protein